MARYAPRRQFGIRMPTANAILLILVALVLCSLVAMLGLLQPEEVVHLDWIIRGHGLALIVLVIVYLINWSIVSLDPPTNKKKETSRR
jgi:hypothetical protein